MRSIWETVVRWLGEAGESWDKPEVKARLKKAHDTMAAKGLDPTDTGHQKGRDAMSRVMQDPDAARLMSQPPGEWEDELGGHAKMQGTPDIDQDELPKPDQPAPGTASGIGAGRIAMKNAEPTSVTLGARGRKFDAGVSGIKQRLGISPDAYYDNSPARVNPTTGKFQDLRGRPKKSPEKNIAGVEGEIEKLQKLLQNPKTDRHRDWLNQRIMDKQAELSKLQTDEPAEKPDIVHEPFAADHAKAAAANAAKKPADRSKIHTYDLKGFAPGGGGHKPKGGSISSTDGGKGIKTSAGNDRLGTFLGQRFAPAGHTAPTDSDWEENPELAARRMGGKGASKLGYGRQDVGQRGRMTVPGSPGQSPGTTFNPYTGNWETDAEQQQSLKDPDVRAKIAAKLALRGADISNKRFGQERRPHASRSTAEPLGAPVPKDANTQKADARAAAIASKPLGAPMRRDDEPPKHQYKKEPEQAPQSGGSAGSGGDAGPIDRSRMKQFLAQRMAAMAAKKTEK